MGRHSLRVRMQQAAGPLKHPRTQDDSVNKAPSKA